MILEQEILLMDFLQLKKNLDNVEILVAKALSKEYSIAIELVMNLCLVYKEIQTFPF